jgi:hypothetical protein
MYYSPHTHLALARERQADLIREARRNELARLVPKDERPGFIARLAGRLHLHQSPRPAANSV